MSQSSGFAQFKNKIADTVKTRSKSKKEGTTVVVDATPISSIPATSSKKKKSAKSTKKVSESSPSISIKSDTIKSKKKKPQSPVKRGLSMSDLYLSKNPSETANVESHDVASGKNANVESSNKANEESVKPVSEKVNQETLSAKENPSSVETLGKTQNVAENVFVTNNPSVPENMTVPTNVITDVAEKSQEKAVVPMRQPIGSNTEASTDEEVNKESTPEHVADSEPENEAGEDSEKTTNEQQNIVDVDEVPSEEDLQPPPTQKGIGRRLRSRTTTPAPAVTTTPVATKKTKDTTLKPVKYGPKKEWSKSIPPPEKKKGVLKRKSAPSSDSDFEAEKDDSSIKPPAKKAMSAKKAMPQAAAPDTEDFPCKDILECEEIVSLINDAGLIKTVWGLGSCYEKLVREFVVNIPIGCDNPLDKEYQKVYVRGKCVTFSPSVINKVLGNADDPHPDIDVSNNVVCKTITAEKVKTWPKKEKVPAVKLTQKYAILNRIASVNWVATTHASDIATNLVVQHAKTSVTKQPIAFPTLICDIILSQHPNIRHEGETAKKRATPLAIHQKLYSKQHAPDIVGPSNAAADKEGDDCYAGSKLVEEVAAQAANAGDDGTSGEEEADSDAEGEESDSSPSASV
ncbi:histone-lysine N-methyltransferase, H3 lysine-9 specific-like [Trifolium pratense]|uniref:histone-lysine N-methyltransferase, H3 lysine-9 specific-like n=1 Tax=Trifolium pratense TaxID=57577 RepID=UPI001E691EAD|nr:histone-lysine N-methyltransferase, H3 lysine-9 specific-like [Trifolium pratense]